MLWVYTIWKAFALGLALNHLLLSWQENFPPDLDVWYADYGKVFTSFPSRRRHLFLTAWRRYTCSSLTFPNPKFTAFPLHTPVVNSMPLFYPPPRLHSSCISDCLGLFLPNYSYSQAVEPPLNVSSSLFENLTMLIWLSTYIANLSEFIPLLNTLLNTQSVVLTASFDQKQSESFHQLQLPSPERAWMQASLRPSQGLFWYSTNLGHYRGCLRVICK